MAASSDAVVRYVVDPRASQFTVQAFASGLISAIAHSPKISIRGYTAETTFVPGTLANAKLKVIVKSNTLEVLDEMREADRREIHRVMFDEVLESKRYPEIVFESTSISGDKLKENLNRVNVEGRLVLHGVTSHQSFFCQVAFGDDSFRAYGEFTLLQSEYGIRIASIAGGTLKLQDELRFSFYVVGRKS
jgi:polyisoprenoid-binding protein YceI